MQQHRQNNNYLKGKFCPVSGLDLLLFSFDCSLSYTGLILALTKCLTEVDVIWRQEQPCLLPLTTHLVTCCCQVIDSMLEVMASVAGQGRMHHVSLWCICLINFIGFLE